MNKGFTLVETLSTIVILSGIIIIAMPAYNGIASTIKTTNYNNKKEAIEAATLKYANLYLMDDIKPESCISNCSKCYDLYTFIIANGIYTAEAVDELGKPIIINPKTGGKLTGCVNLEFDINDAALSAELRP